MKIGDKVQVWSDKKSLCLGWGKIIRIATTSDGEEIPLIQLESGLMRWGSDCYWIEEKKAVEIGLSIFRAVTGGDINER